jgi:hypothetical protein
VPERGGQAGEHALALVVDDLPELAMHDLGMAHHAPPKASPMV